MAINSWHHKYERMQQYEWHGTPMTLSMWSLQYLSIWCIACCSVEIVMKAYVDHSHTDSLPDINNLLLCWCGGFGSVYCTPNDLVLVSNCLNILYHDNRLHACQGVELNCIRWPCAPLTLWNMHTFDSLTKKGMTLPFWSISSRDGTYVSVSGAPWKWSISKCWEMVCHIKL